MVNRRWGKELDQVILKVTWEQLNSVGYEHLTISDVAKIAKTNKNAIYRRWRNKPELVFTTIKNYAPNIDTKTPDEGSLFLDLKCLFLKFKPVFDTPPKETWGKLLAETFLTSTSKPFVKRFITVINSDNNYVNQQVKLILINARKRNEPIRSDITSNELNLPALLLINQILLHETVTENQVDKIVKGILMPIYSLDKEFHS